jgi:hypothetical protein
VVEVMSFRNIRALLVAAAVGALVLAAPLPAAHAGDGKADVAVSVDGVVKVHKGDSQVESTEGAKLAVAVNGSTTTVHGDGSKAVAVNDSTASASGKDSQALAVNDSTASARGRDSTAMAVNDSTATARGRDSLAKALNGATVTDGSCDGDHDDGGCDGGHEDGGGCEDGDHDDGCDGEH